jgi:hypothetical protein
MKSRRPRFSVCLKSVFDAAIALRVLLFATQQVESLIKPGS